MHDRYLQYFTLVIRFQWGWSSDTAGENTLYLQDNRTVKYTLRNTLMFTACLRIIDSKTIVLVLKAKFRRPTAQYNTVQYLWCTHLQYPTCVGLGLLLRSYQDIIKQGWAKHFV